MAGTNLRTPALAFTAFPEASGRGGIKRGTGTASAFRLLSCALKFSAELDFQTWLTLQLLKARVESGWHGGRSTGIVPVSQHSG